MLGGSRTVAVVLHILKRQPWSDTVKAHIEAGLAAHPSVQVEFADPEGDAQEQIHILEGYLQRRIDALIVLPIDPELTRSILARYREAQIPVIVLDNDVGAPDLYRALILADNRQFGRDVGTWFVEVTGGVGALVEIRGITSTSAAADRSQGFREALASHPRLRIVDSCVGDWIYDRAYREFSELLTRHRRIDGVFAQSDEMARAALDAAEQVGRAGEMLVTGIDALQSSIRLVAEGRLAATFLNPSPGKQAVHTLQAILNGEPCLKKILLHTSAFQSNERVRAWQEARRRLGVPS